MQRGTGGVVAPGHYRESMKIDQKNISFFCLSALFYTVKPFKIINLAPGAHQMGIKIDCDFFAHQNEYLPDNGGVQIDLGPRRQTTLHTTG